MSQAAPVTRREATIASLLVAAWWIGLAMWNGGILITKRFWLDELCCTVYALRDSSNPVELVRNALAYDIAPPLLHLMTWPVTLVFGVVLLGEQVTGWMLGGAALIVSGNLLALLRRRRR